MSSENPKPTGRPLRVGFLLNTLEHGMDGRTPRWTDLAEMARTAEQVGFDSIWVGDRLLVQDANQKVGIWEATTVLAALANETSRADIGLLVLRSIYRNPALVAKIADSLDEISGGRFTLGMAVGSAVDENESFGYPEDHPVGRFEEAIAIVHGLLRHGQMDFEGTYYRVRDCELRPRGPRPQGPPLLIAARAPRMMKLAARYADIWNRFLVYQKNQLQDVEQAQKDMDAACRAEERDPASLQRTGFVKVDMSQNPGEDSLLSRQSAYGGPPVSGTPEEVAATFRDLADAGFSEIQAWLTPNTPQGIESFGRAIEVLDKS